MTNRSGQIVQHYGYSAFGQQRYKDTTIPAFDVTNRYTGQQIDEETGLYFYQSRYYDPQLGRFIQADTIVPETDTSQALNRYTYVKNNPLKFTDPSGHGWFSKIWDKVKSWVGTILTVALCIAAPWGSGFWATLANSAIGSAVGAAVNGGTWKSFAIGVAIGAAAGFIANGIGAQMFGGGFNGQMCWSAFTEGTMPGIFMAGALTGAVSGAISSGIYAGNWGQNILAGASGGAIGAGIGMIARATIITGIRVTQEILRFVERFSYSILNTIGNMIDMVADYISGHRGCGCTDADKITIWACRRTLGSPVDPIAPKIAALAHTFLCRRNPALYTADPENCPCFGKQPAEYIRDQNGNILPALDSTQGPGYIEEEPVWEINGVSHRDFTDCVPIMVCPHDPRFNLQRGPTQDPYSVWGQWLFFLRRGSNCHDWGNGRTE